MQRMPVIGSADASNDGYFDTQGYPTGEGWDEVLFPDVGDPHAFAMKVSDDSLIPVCRQGDLIIVSPTTELRRGDRAIVKTRKNRILAGEVSLKSMNRLELMTFAPEKSEVKLLDSDVDWSARILWAQQ